MPPFSPRQALVLSLAASLLTMALKTGAWYLTGSVGYLSDAMESVVNLAGAGFALLMVSYAMRPADEGHPFGHGKAEYFSAAFEGGMILFAALGIIAAAVSRLLAPVELDAIGIGALLSVLATLVNLAVARILLKVGRETRSPALVGDGKHLMTDVWTSVGVIGGVSLAAVTGQYWLDPVVAIVVALHILHEGGKLLYGSAGGLMDSALNPAEIAEIEAVLETFSERGCRFANLRTRGSGIDRFVNLEMLVPGGWDVSRAHELADEVEVALQHKGFIAVTHVEPLDDVE